jgi:hypothetical protein
MSMILTLRCTVAVIDRASRFRLRTTQTADVRWPSMSDSRWWECRTVSDIDGHMSVRLYFEKSQVLLEIQHPKKV